MDDWTDIYQLKIRYGTCNLVGCDTSFHHIFFPLPFFPFFFFFFFNLQASPKSFTYDFLSFFFSIHTYIHTYILATLPNRRGETKLGLDG